jgi:signal transduction histidine kinase
MRLGHFILSAKEAILSDWEQFAAAQLPGSHGMSRERLRDHAGQMLDVIASDLAETQTAAAQAQKAKGLVVPDPLLPDTAAQVHAFMRAQDGFDVNQMVGEYRALRASVLRLWAAQEDLHPTAFEDMVRFNEAIDQALVESVASFTEEVDRQRNLMLGMLGHDMRNPLNAMLMAAELMARDGGGDEKLQRTVERMRKSGLRMRMLLDDLVDLSSAQLGVGLRLRRRQADLGVAFLDEVDLLRAAFPGAVIELHRSGDTTGNWDAGRLQQVLGNLVTNALKYGTCAPVQVALEGQPDDVTFIVSNQGRAIDQELLLRMFEPLKRGDRTDVQGLGLGLFIVHQVVDAHGGDVKVTSTEAATQFTVTLPRR